MTPTATCPWENPAIVTGPAKGAILAYNVAPPCWCLTRTASAASLRPLRTATSPPPPRPPKIPKTGVPQVEAAVPKPRPFPKTEDAFRRLRVACPPTCPSCPTVPHFCSSRSVLLSNQIFLPKLSTSTRKRSMKYTHLNLSFPTKTKKPRL